MAKSKKKGKWAQIAKELASFPFWAVREEELNAKPYDGVFGRLPEWMPPILNQEFRSARVRLLDEHSHAQILTWIAECSDPSKVELKNGSFRNHNIPLDVSDDVQSLDYVKYIYSLGPIQGIQYYLSEKSAAAYKGEIFKERARATAKRPRQDALQRLIVNIVKGSPEITWREVFHAIKAKKSQGIIEDVEGDDISGGTIHWIYDSAHGHSRSVPITGLKDRVSRAKKFINSR
jgi:hypothetical protein